MKALVALVVLFALAAPAAAHDYYGGIYNSPMSWYVGPVRTSVTIYNPYADSRYTNPYSSFHLSPCQPAFGDHTHPTLFLW